MHKVSVECVPPLPGNTVYIIFNSAILKNNAQTITQVAQSSVLCDDGINDVMLKKNFQCEDIAFVIMKTLMQCHSCKSTIRKAVMKFNVGNTLVIASVVLHSTTCST